MKKRWGWLYCILWFVAIFEVESQAATHAHRRTCHVHLKAEGAVTFSLLFSRPGFNTVRLDWSLGKAPQLTNELRAHIMYLYPRPVSLAPGRWKLRVLWWFQPHSGFVREGWLSIGRKPTPLRLHLTLGQEGTLSWHRYKRGSKALKLQLRESIDLKKLRRKPLRFELANRLKTRIHGVAFGGHFFGHLERKAYRSWLPLIRGHFGDTAGFRPPLKPNQVAKVSAGDYVDDPARLKPGHYRFVLVYSAKEWPQYESVDRVIWPFPSPRAKKAKKKAKAAAARLKVKLPKPQTILTFSRLYFPFTIQAPPKAKAKCIGPKCVTLKRATPKR